MMDLIEVTENNNRHPWELSRTKCILKELAKLGINGNVLDIGCGDSYFDFQLLKQNPDLNVYGVDINLEKEFDEENIHAFNSLNHLPNIKFDFIIMMDVLEHIENDKGYLKDILEYLSSNGTIFITVPAFMSLYSLHDEELKHFRRYNHDQLSKIIEYAGLNEINWSYFYFSLIIGRLLTKNQTKNLGGWAKPNDSIITKSITKLLNIDFRILRTLSNLGIHIPGLSLMSICKKEE